MIFLFFTQFPSCSGSEIYFRFNQIGFYPSELKSVIIISNVELKGEKFIILQNSEQIISGLIPSSKGKYGNFSFSYEIWFSELTEPGEYKISVGGIKSDKFEVHDNLYKNLADSLLQFFKVQRCGYTNPLQHDICHIYDATSLILGNDTLNIHKDVTGGWHDAGDYVKFFNTTAYSTYLLLFAYEFDKGKFSYDKNKNWVPDILEEAKVGLDWLKRCEYEDKFITQVQTLQDHEVGWRLPEDDILLNNRPAFIGAGKNLTGIYCAVMSLASRIWREDVKYPEFADECLKSAEKYYSNFNNVPNIDSSGSGMYLDNTYTGKMALGAVELYITTNNNKYLNDALMFADSAKSDYWWGWGNINSLAHYKIAKYNKNYVSYIKNNLEAFNTTRKTNIFGEGVKHIWGTNLTLAGIVLQNILYKKITGSSEYDSLASIQKDYLLGRNPWGVSFFTGFGSEYSKNLHHQISFLKKKNLAGGFAAGPVQRTIHEQYKIPSDTADCFSKFQTSEILYYDKTEDYITNEPTISANATAIFIFGLYD